MGITSLGNVGNASVPVKQGEAPAAPRPTAPATPAQTPTVSQQSSPSRQAVEQAAKEIQRAMDTMTSRDLHFTINSDTNQTVVRVVDSGTGDVIRQIPSEEIIDIAKAMNRAQGLLLRQKA